MESTVLVYSNSIEEHLVFGRIRSSGLKLHPQKCHLGYHEVKYLGHVISSEGISPDPDKVKAVADFKVPIM